MGLWLRKKSFLQKILSLPPCIHFNFFSEVFVDCFSLKQSTPQLSRILSWYEPATFTSDFPL